MKKQITRAGGMEPGPVVPVYPPDLRDRNRWAGYDGDDMETRRPSEGWIRYMRERTPVRVVDTAGPG